MKKYLSFLFIVFSFPVGISAQQLVVSTTRFVGGDASCGYSETRYAIPTSDGGVLFVGLTTCYSGGGDIPANFPDTGADNCGNVLIGKLDSNMNVSWVKVYGGTSCDLATGAVQTPDGGYAVLAYTGSNDIDVSSNHGSEDLWLIRLDASGNLLWQKCYGSAYDEQSGAIALTPDGGFIFYGVSNGAGGDVPTHYSGSEFDYDWVVIKTDSTGNKQWAKSIGGLGDEETYGSIISANNAYYLVSTSNSTDHDCTDTAWCAGNGHGTEYNYYIFKLDTTAGNILWDSSYGGSGGEIVYSALWDSRDSSIVMNGLTTSSNYMVTGYHSGLQDDMWVVKTDKNGTLKWETCLGGPNIDIGTGITIAPHGYMAYGNTDPGSVGHENAWLFAIDNDGNQIINKVFGGTGYDVTYSITPFRNGFAATGATGSPSFTEGTNIGHLPGLVGEVFASYINYWPLSVPMTNAVNEQLAVCPNPSNTVAKITLPNKEVGKIIITNCLGESIYKVNTDQGVTEISINTDCWASGLYIVKWQSEDGCTATTKLIKN
jgi:type IX secretion system substrate protein